SDAFIKPADHSQKLGIVRFLSEAEIASAEDEWLDQAFESQEMLVIHCNLPHGRPERRVPGGSEALRAGPAAQAIGPVAAHADPLRGIGHRTRHRQKSEKPRLNLGAPAISPRAQGNRIKRRNTRRPAARRASCG